MIKILKYLQIKEWFFVAISIVFIVGQVYLDLKIPDYMAEITKLVQTPNSPIREIWIDGGYMILCTLGSLAASAVVGYYAARVAATLAKRVRAQVFNKVASFSMEEVNRFSTPSLITRSTNDITQVQTIIAMGMQVLIKAPILVVWALIKISGKNIDWTIATGVAVGVLLLMILSIVIFAMPKFKVIQTLTDNLNRVTRENLTGLRVVRAYNAEHYQTAKFEQANVELTNTNLFVNRMMAVFWPGMSLIMSGLSLAIYWIGAYLIDAAMGMQKLTLFSDMIVFSSYAMQVVFAFMMLTMIFIMLPRAVVSAKRILEVLNTEASIKNGTVKTVPTAHKGEVEFRNVSFKYPGGADYVLQNISFTAKQGETIAFIGSTGSGKSSLVNLIPRFYDCTEGEVFVNGVNVKNYDQQVLNNKIGYVPQKAVLFSGDISSNVGFGDNGTGEYTSQAIERAVDIAQGKEFVTKMEGQYAAAVSQGGTNLSGGQKQRIAIARAVCRTPEIYIFDDSFSALDYKTDAKLRDALKKETTQATNLIVAQRIGTIREADKIIVLDEGRIVGMGTHHELMNSCDVYQQIAYSQLSEEELGHV
jgi:ATP-binding cassette subfamily B protein